MKRWLPILLILFATTLSLITCSLKHYKTVGVEEKGVDKELSSITLLSELNYIYETYISENRNYTTRLYLSHFLSNDYKNSDLFFNNHHRSIALKPETDKKTVKEVKAKVISAGSGCSTIVRFIRRIIPGYLSKKKKPRVLVIGDSVTSGYGSESNKSENWMPSQYWAYTKMFFELEKIDNGNKADEYNALFIGSWTDGSFTIHHNGVERRVKAMAEGYGGASLEQLFKPIFGNADLPNRFYDETKGTFSIKSYLSKYRTMDDNGERLVSSKINPAGECVKGTDGKEYVIGTEITSQDRLSKVDVCTPSIIVINLCHNTTLKNYQKNIGPVLNTINKELPDTKVVLMTIDEAGTLFPTDYPNYAASQITYTGLHEKNAAIYNYLKEKVENESKGVYVFASQFVMPTMESVPSIEKEGKYGKDSSVIAPNYHPNNKAHEVWGYALYSLIKWIIS